MSINNLNTYLNVRDAHLRVVSGNVYAQAMNIGGINVETAHGLQSVSDTGNVTSNTLQFSNATTGFVTTANAQIGRDLVVTGNATVSKELTVTSNAIVSSNLNVSDDLIVTNNILASNNLTVTGNLNVTTIRSDSNVVAEYTGPHDRPLRKYPEVALSVTSESASGENGYKVAASKASTTFGTEYTVFDGLKGAAGANYIWRPYAYNGGTTQLYNAGTGLYDPTAITAAGEEVAQLDTNTEQGEWISVELPKAIKLKHFHIYSQWNSLGNLVTSGHLYAKNVSTDSWVKIHSFNDVTTTSVEVPTVHHVNSTSPYKYFALIVTKSTGQPTIGEWELYGYEEGSGSLDTTLKSVYNVPATTGTQLEVYYDAKNYTSGTITDESPNTYVGTLNGNTQLETVDGIKAFTFDGNGDTITGTIPGISGEYVHSITFWIKFNDFSTANTGYTLFEMGARSQDDIIGLYAEPGKVNYYFYSNDNSYSLNGVSSGNLIHDQWYHFTATYSGGSDLSNRKLYINGNEIPRSTHGGASSGALTLANGNFSIGDIIGGTGLNDFAGSIANFRIYSKALNAEQIQELYDFQKDYFLGSKSQVTLYKGHLGVGVTEPSGQLELAGDERIQEYPPKGMFLTNTNNFNSSDPPSIDSYIEGHGVFTATSSMGNVYESQGPHRAFNDEYNWATYPSHIYWGGPNAGYDVNTYLYTGNVQLSSKDGTPKGQWIKLKLPYHIKVNSYFTQTINTGGMTGYYGVKSGQLWGSNDDVNWSFIHGFSDLNATTSGHYHDISTNNESYKYLALIIIKNFGQNPTYVSSGSGDRMGIQRIRYFGTPGPTTLDKGSLTLGRSLDVPRVSRYDVDTETPRPEKLVVDFDTTVNSSPTDISGRGNHGTFYNGASYSPADKAFDFNNTQGGIRSQTTLFDTSGKHSFAAWMKFDSFGRWYGLYGIGTTGGATNFTIYTGTGASDAATYNTGFRLESRGGGRHQDLAWTPVLNKWVHVAVTWDGTGGLNNVNMYIDLVKLERQQLGTYENNPTSSITLPTTQAIRVGADAREFTGAGAGSNFDGQISNPKFYSEVLEFSEIKKLYNLGRTGRSMVISDTAVGIGKAPEAQLDVRGNLRVGGRGQIETLAPRYYSSMQRGTFHDVSSHIITGFDHQAEGYATPVLGWEVHINFNHDRTAATSVTIDGGYLSNAPTTHVAVTEAGTHTYTNTQVAVYNNTQTYFRIGTSIAHAHAAVYAVIRITNSQVPGIPSAIHAGNGSTVRYHLYGHTVYVYPGIGSSYDVAVGRIVGGNDARLHGIRMATGAGNLTGAYTIYTYH